jgi:DNA-binding phage protein
VINVTLAGVRSRTAAEKYLDQRRSDPENAEAFETASRRVAMFDDVVHSLDARRVELGFTKAELARRADMPPAAVRRLFSQQQKNPTLTTLIAIADALDLRVTASAVDGLRFNETLIRPRPHS